MKYLIRSACAFRSPKRKRGKFNPLLALRAQTFALLLLALLTPTARSALEPGTKKPYQLEIVLQIASNRVFTPLFQDQLQRDVQNQLRISFGNLARIEVTRDHPILRHIEAKGLDSALESWDSLSERTTHFVLLDYVAGTYQIQTRFHDGVTGQAAPFTRRTWTNDRASVAATIAQLIEASFSPVGTVTAVGKDVTLKLQGGELGVPMDRWVKRGNVFAVSRIFEENGKQRAARLEWAHLEVLNAPVKGECHCRYWHRYQEDTLSESPGTLGYRALWLPTGTGVVKVQLLDATSQKPLEGVRVRVKGSNDESKPEELSTDKNGLAVTNNAFTHFAVIEVVTGKKDSRGKPITPTLPVALIEGRTVIARMSIQEDRESLAPLEVRRDAWLRRVYDNVRMSSERAQELSGQLNQSLEAALDSGRKSLPLLDAEIKYLDREQDDLSRLAKEKKISFDPREGQQQIDELRKQIKDLQAFVQRLEGVLKESAGSEKTLGLHKLLERARLLETEADFDQAIRLYDQVVQANPEQAAKIKAHVEQLKKGWATKGDDHAKARAFVYQTWPTLDVAGLQKNMKIANDALAIFRANDDKLTPQKLLRVNVTHTANLKKQLDILKRRDSEDNRNQAKTVVQISEGLLRLHNEAAGFLAPRKE
jgi:hypothetical protein